MKTYEECEQLIIDTEFNGVAPIIHPQKLHILRIETAKLLNASQETKLKTCQRSLKVFIQTGDEVDLSRKEFYKFKQMVFECCISEAYITMNTATGISRKQFDILNELVTNFDSDLDDLDSESDEYFQYLYERIYEVNSYIIRYETP